MLGREISLKEEIYDYVVRRLKKTFGLSEATNVTNKPFVTKKTIITGNTPTVIGSASTVNNDVSIWEIYCKFTDGNYFNTSLKTFKTDNIYQHTFYGVINNDFLNDKISIDIVTKNSLLYIELTNDTNDTVVVETTLLNSYPIE